MRLSLALVALAATLFSAGAAEAQSQPIPPEHYTLDPRGVDLVSGTFNFGTTEVVIGQPGAGGLSYGRVWTNDGWRDATIGGISYSSEGMVVSAGPISEVFVYNGSDWVPKYPNGTTMVITTAAITVTDRHGNVAVFSRDIGLNPDDNPYGAEGGLATSISSPDGSVTNYHFKSAQKCFEYAGGSGGICIDWRPIYRLAAVTNSYGHMIKYTYGSEDPQSTAWWRVSTVRGINLATDWCDALASSCPSFSQTWPSVSYDAATPALTATDQSGRITAYTYVNGSLATVRWPDAVRDDISVAYNASPDFRVNQVVDASGQWNYAYSVTGTTQTTTVTGPMSQGLIVETDMSKGRATSVTDALNNKWQYQYDADLRVTRITQPEGNYVTYVYDARSNLTETTFIPKPGAVISSITLKVDYPSDCTTPVIIPQTLCNKPITTTDARGGITDYVWDEGTGQLVSVTRPAPSNGAARPQSRFSYATFRARYRDSASTYANGPPTSLHIKTSACVTGAPQVPPVVICGTSANEVLSSTTYPTAVNPNNLLPVATSAGSGDTPIMAQTNFTYTPQGDVLTINGPLSGTADTTTFVYSSSDPRQRIGLIDPDPDGAGPGLHRAQRLTYNNRGQVTRTEVGTASGAAWANFVPIVKSETVYIPSDYFRPSITRQMSAGGSVAGLQQVTYDTAGRPSCVAVRMNPTEFSNLPSSACSLDTVGGYGPDRVVQTTYDAVGRPLMTNSALGTTDALTESVTYTANGKVASLTDGRGNASVMEYDGFDRLAKLRYPNATGGGTSTTDYEQYAFDTFGRPLSARNRSGALTYFGFDNLNRLITINAPTGTPDINSGYDNLGRMTVTGNGVITDTFSYDGLSRITAESSSGVGTMSYQYDPASHLTQIKWPDSFYVDYIRDVYGAVTAIRENGVTSGPGLLATYAWNDLGRPVSATRASGAGASSSWGYDAYGRLASLTHDASGTSNDLTLAYSYSPAGQITGRTVSNNAYTYTPAAAGTNYSNNGLNQVTAIGGSPVTYGDGNGNITSISSSTFGFDAANRLTSSTTGGDTATYAFDPQGRLASTTASGATTRFQYSGAQQVTEYDSTGQLLARHVPGLGLDNVVATYASGSTPSWLLSDERGSIVALAGPTATVSTINLYDEYGVPASGNAGRFQYTGQPWLPAAGVYHFPARDYFAPAGRFLQPDPSSYRSGSNLYAYVGADPINMVDIFGLQESPFDVGDVTLTYTCEEIGKTTHWSGSCVPRITSMSQLIIFGALDTSFAPGGDSGSGGGGGGGGTPAERQCTLAEARQWHNIIQAKVALEMLAAGYMVTPNVTIQNPATGFRAVADLVVSRHNGFGPVPVAIIEIKTGDARLTENQEDVYGAIGEGGVFIPRGWNALRAGWIPGMRQAGFRAPNVTRGERCRPSLLAG